MLRISTKTCTRGKLMLSRWHFALFLIPPKYSGILSSSHLVRLTTELHVTAKTQDVILDTDSNVTLMADVPSWQL